MLLQYFVNLKRMQMVLHGFGIVVLIDVTASVWIMCEHIKVLYFKLLQIIVTTPERNF